MHARLTLLLVAWLLTSFAAAQPAERGESAVSRLERDDFGHYTLALTWHAGFCATRSSPPRECREPTPHEGASQGFVLHGLWPSLPERFAERGVDRRRWWAEGCFLERPRADGGFCRARPPFGFDAPLAEALDEAMPGRASCLDRYQYAKHAACFAIEPADYFAAALDLQTAVNDSAFGAFVTLNHGGEVARNDLIEAFEAAFGEGTGRALRLECRGRANRVLTEVRIAIDAERLGDFPDAESLVRQQRGRCATRVTIAVLE
ncbi:ribonuclease T2 family protein [Billgrantia gudaonensis]|uniref:Ribonuclease I n=1 Tax=Billgrantia gudaonensis TaxID=376427 RepID=A0A1G8QCF6_9GAMM|nr:ribonuclease I [Halomonas gudaonensis]SDJ02243.1 ribonuclease I [Halomonas gudaonensis]